MLITQLCRCKIKWHKIENVIWEAGMAANLRMIRIQKKLDEIFSDRIDLTDITYSENLPDEYYS